MKTALEIAQLVGGSVAGDADASVSGVAGLEQASASEVSFFGNRKYKKQLAGTQAGVVLVAADAPPKPPQVKTYIHVANPHLAFARVSQLFHPVKQHVPGISPNATVHGSAQVDPSATVMDFVYISSGARIGPRAVLHPGVYVGADAVVGEDTVLSAHVALMDGCQVGARCLIHANAVIGSDGFGFAFDASIPAHVKIPQVGVVRMEDDVEMGACSCIDRGSTGQTVIGRGTKIDNLVQIGHNTTIGPHSILCAQVGLAGTTELGTGVVLAGQVGVSGHLRIGDGARVAAQTGVIGDLDDGAVVMGTPSIPMQNFMRSAAVYGRLPELHREVRELKKRLNALEQGKTQP